MGGGGKERAYVVEVDVGAAEVVQDEIADRVGALDGVAVVGEGGEEPGVFFGDEGVGFGVGPELGRRCQLALVYLNRFSC